MLVGHKKEVEKYKKQMMEYFECDDIGELKDCVGCKIDRSQQGKYLKMTQPVIIQSFEEKFEVQKLRLMLFLVKYW